MPIGSILGLVLPAIMQGVGQGQANQANRAQLYAAEGFQANMADTAMQRRVADLKAAGLNPMLATGTAGAMVPTPSPLPMGNVAGGASGMGNAAQIVAQTRLTNAQAAQVESNTLPSSSFALPLKADSDGKPTDEIDWDAVAQGGFPHAQAFLNAHQLITQVNQAKAATDAITTDMNLTKSKLSGQDIQNKISGLNQDLLSGLLDWSIKQGIAEAKIAEAGVPAAQANQAVMSGKWGVVIEAISKVLNVAQGATSVAGGLRSMALKNAGGGAITSGANINTAPDYTGVFHP